MPYTEIKCPSIVIEVEHQSQLQAAARIDSVTSILIRINCMELKEAARLKIQDVQVQS